MADSTLTYNSAYTLPANAFTRSGYTFDGWATSASGNVRYGDRQTLAAAMPLTATQGTVVTLYAVWSKDGTPVNTRNATFAYTGAPQTWVAPKTGVYLFEAWGAQGGTAGSSAGGMGGYTTGRVSLSEGQTIYIYVGGQGYAYEQTTNAGGWNGGGYSGNNGSNVSTGGGGATDFRLSPGTWNNAEGLGSRVMVAAGGGGGSKDVTTAGGWGGGLTGGAGTSSNATYNNVTYLPQGDSQTAGGLGYLHDAVRSGVLGSGVQLNSGGWGGGGGGGHYGGGNGHGTTGAGGSSYVSGLGGCSVHTSMAFTLASTTSGVRSGNGQAKITYLSKVEFRYHKAAYADVTVHETSVVLPVVDGTRSPAYAFMGWYDAEEGGYLVGSPGSTYVPSDDIVIHAHWEPIEFSGTLDPGNSDENHDGYGDNIALSVPSSINYVVKVDGTLVGPDNATIQNHNNFEIRVSSIDVDAMPPFSIVNVATGLPDSVDLAIGPQGHEVSAADYLLKVPLADTPAWHVPAASGTTPGTLLLGTSGHVDPLTTAPLSSSDFATIQWYVKMTG